MTTSNKQTNTRHPKHSGPSKGLKVLEMGQLIAGPFACKTLADFGADAIKIEAPGSGDPLRQWRLLKDGTSVWWQVQSRSKQSVALDLRAPEGRTLCGAWRPNPMC
jgi:formyl-CoA transferase